MHAISFWFIIFILSLLVSGPSGVVMVGDDRLGMAVEELQDLRGVWVELGKIWDQLDEFKEKPWVLVQPRKVRHTRTLSLSLTHTFMHFSLFILDTPRS